MSKMYDMWLCKMIKSREETMSLKKSLSFRREKRGEGPNDTGASGIKTED